MLRIMDDGEEEQEVSRDFQDILLEESAEDFIEQWCEKWWIEVENIWKIRFPKPVSGGTPAPEALSKTQ